MVQEGNFLEGYFKEQRMNIVGNILTEFNQEDYDRNRRAEGYEDGYDDGRALGRSEGKIEGERQNAIANAKNLLKLGVTPETIAQGCSLPLEQVLALQSELKA